MASWRERQPRSWPRHSTWRHFSPAWRLSPDFTRTRTPTRGSQRLEGDNAMKEDPNEGNASTGTDVPRTRRSSAIPIVGAIVLVIALVGVATLMGRNGSTPLASA